VYWACVGGNFTFGGESLLKYQLAAQALLDQVFIDSDAGLFDSSPMLIFGCHSSLLCKTLVPVIPVDSFNLYSVIAVNSSPDFFQPDGVTNEDITTFFDTSNSNFYNWAVWTKVETDVPEPSSSFIWAMGVFFLFLARSQKRTVTLPHQVVRHVHGE
jgi:hypothetical protein